MDTTWTCACGRTNTGTGPCDRCLARPPAGVVDPVVVPGRPRAVRLLTVAVVVLLVSGLVALVAVASDGSSAGPGRDLAAGLADGPSSSVLIGPDSAVGEVADDQVRAAAQQVGALHAFVARGRGLPWQAPVEVTFLSPAGFVRRLQEQNQRDQQDLVELQETARVLTALHLLDQGVDLEQEVDALLAGAVVGFYDPETKELAVRGTDLASFAVRSTIVHELTHALQDQHFGLDRPELDQRDDEASTAFAALAEGDAVRVEGLYLGSLPLADQKRAEREQLEDAAASGLSPDTPRILLELIAFPYVFGPPFVEAVVAAGGQGRLDQAFRQPPVSTEQILDPRLYLEGVGPVEVAKPEAGGEVIDEGVMGEYVLALLLSRAGERRLPSQSTAAAWRGDWYRAWDEGRRTCVRARIATTGTDATRQLQQALEAWRRSNDGVRVSVEPEGTVLFTSCS